MNDIENSVFTHEKKLGGIKLCTSVFGVPLRRDANFWIFFRPSATQYRIGQSSGRGERGEVNLSPEGMRFENKNLDFD